MEHPDRLITLVIFLSLFMGLICSSTELVPSNVCNNAFAQGEHGPSLLVFPKRCCWAQITSQFMQSKAMGSCLLSIWFLGWLALLMWDSGKQWRVVPCTFTQLGKQDPVQTKSWWQRAVWSRVISVINLSTEEGSNQNHVETVGLEFNIEKAWQENISN